MEAGKRLKELLLVAKTSRVDNPKVVIEKFLWVFGNIIQEYFADRIYEEARSGHDWEQAVSMALEGAREMFGENDSASWPFHLSWLKEYIMGRYLGKRKGIFKEDKRYGYVEKFRREASNSHCQWYLGCPLKDDLMVDHIWPWSLHGTSDTSDLQWLCRKHNINWKKNLICWDNFIPFRNYRKEDMPR